MNVTTEHLKMTIDGKEISPYSSEYPLLLIPLRQNERFKCHMKAVLGVGERNVVWSAIRNGIHSIDTDDKGKTSYTLTFEGNQQCNESEYLIRACKHIIKKMIDLKNDLTDKINTKQIIPEKKIYFKIDNEDHTIGELLNYHFQDHNDILMSGYSKPDHLIKSILIKIIANGKVNSPLDGMLDSIDLIIKKISQIGFLVTNMYDKKSKPKSK